MDISELSAEGVEVSATKEQLKQIGELTKSLQTFQQREVELTSLLKGVQKRIRQIEMVDLPDALAEAGLGGVTTPDGREVAIEEKLYASIPKKNMPAACSWLDAHDHGALIKPQLIVAFNNGEQGKMAELSSALIEQGYAGLSATQTVNTGSVKALIKELTEEGVDIPLDLFGAHWVKRAIIKDPK